MTLIDPREALADQSNFIGYLLGLAGLGQVVHALAAEGDVPPDTVRDADDFVHLLLGLASIGKSIERLAESAVPRSHSVSVSPLSASTTTRWLR